MADVDEIYKGIISPDGGLYSPKGGIYSGILPNNTPKASGLTSRQVQTVAVDPFTGKPLTAGGTAQSKEVVVPGGQVQGTGYQSGYVAPPSHRLLPSPPGMTIKTPATEAISTAVPDLRGMVLNSGSRDTVAQRVAGLGFRPPQMDNGIFGVPMSKTMTAMLGNDPGYAAQRGVLPQAVPQANPQVAQAMLGRDVQNLIGTIQGGGQPGTNAIIRTINQSSNPDAARDQIGLAMGGQIRKSATPSKTVTGSDNRFMPKSVQNSVRFQTGY